MKNHILFFITLSASASCFIATASEKTSQAKLQFLPLYPLEHHNICNNVAQGLNDIVKTGTAEPLGYHLWDMFVTKKVKNSTAFLALAYLDDDSPSCIAHFIVATDSNTAIITGSSHHHAQDTSGNKALRNRNYRLLQAAGAKLHQLGYTKLFQYVNGNRNSLFNETPFQPLLAFDPGHSETKKFLHTKYCSDLHCYQEYCTVHKKAE